MLPSTLDYLRKPAAPGSAADASSLNEVQTARRSIEHGTEFNKNGKEYRVSIVPENTRYFQPTEGMSEEDVAAYDNCFAHLRDAAQVVGRMTNILCDSRRGDTTKGASLLADHWQLVDSPYKTEIAAHLLCILRQGDVLHDKLQSVVVPPCQRYEFEHILGELQSHALPDDFDWNTWLDHLYDATPRVAEGFVTFATPEDEGKFLKGLGDEYAAKALEVQRLFDLAVENGSLSDEEWKRYNHTSQELCQIQKAALDKALEGVNGAKDLSTAGVATVDENGVVACTFTHYTEIFASELSELNKLLLKAADALPESAQQTKEVLRAQADWCVNSNNNDPEWARSLPVWLQANSSDDLIDVNVTCEEVHGSFGKGTFHIAVCQHADTPEALREIAPVIAEAGKVKGIGFLFLRTLITGGHNEQMVVSGEKLPDPENQPFYKSMVFTNTSGTVQIQSYSAAISAALGLTQDQVNEMSWVGPVWVYLHEYGHTLGGVAPYTDRASDIEETNAQASAAYLAARYFPESYEILQNFGVPWTAIRRTQQGPTEMHSRSDIVLIQEYLDAGAVRIVDMGDGDKAQLQIVDPKLLTETAFKTAITMRLWEAGLPTAEHAQFFEDFDPSQGEIQDARIKRAVESHLSNLSQASIERNQRKASLEIESYFANNRLNAIGESLSGVLNSIPKTQPLSVMPTNRSVRKLLVLAAA